MAKQVKAKVAGKFYVQSKQPKADWASVSDEYDTLQSALIAANDYVMQHMSKGHGYCPNVLIRQIGNPTDEIVCVVYTHSPILIGENDLEG